MTRWYVVHTQPGAESRAAFHLRNQRFDVYLPCYRKRRRHARRSELVRAPLFPRYLFVRMDLATRQWRAINGTVGVHYLLSDGEHPRAVPDSIIDAIRQRENDDGVVVLSAAAIRPGERVRLLEGPFADLNGFFESMVDQDRVAILLDLLGRQVRVRVPIDAIAVNY